MIRRQLSHLYASVALCSALALSADPAHAQIDRNNFNTPTWDMQLFRPAIDSRGYVTVNSTRTLGHLEFSFGLIGTWAFQPLSMQLDGGQAYPGSGATVASTRMFSTDHLITPSFQFAIGLFKYVELGIGVPIGVVIGRRQVCTGSGDNCTGYENAGTVDQLRYSKVMIGDLPIHIKARAFDPMTPWSKGFGIGALISAYLPISKWADNEGHKMFLGEGNFTVRPQLIVEKDWGSGHRFRSALNVGALIRFGSETFTDVGKRVPVGNLDYCYPDDNIRSLSTACGTGLSRSVGTQIVYSLALSAAVVPERFDLLGEVFGYADVSGNARAFPLEVLGAAKIYLATNSYLLFGAGTGLIGNGGEHTGSPRVRAFLGFIYEPRVGDRDNDGIPDKEDQCPDQAEDRDNFEDSDGCPDLDNDNDGIPDNRDRCPNEPETKNGQQDEDGCPDGQDRDKDGIPDELDKCPDTPEDKDNFEDSDGCPEPDNDKDRIPDTFDKCPNDPETYNGVEDEDGCPDAEKSRVMVSKGKILILDKVYFDTGKATIKPVSFPILDAVAATLAGNPNLELVEIQGHADERGNDNANLRLTQSRVQSVKDYLVKKGIEASRLLAKGYGETKPLCSEANEACWEKNRRVEFVILKPAIEGSDAAPAPAPAPAPSTKKKGK